MQRMSATVLMTFSGVMMFNWNAGARCFGEVQRRTVAAEHLYWRPLRQNREGRGCVRSKLLAGVNNPAANDREDGFDVFDLFFRYGKVVIS